MTNVVPIKSGKQAMAIVPETFEDVYRIAKCIAESGLAPNGMQKPEQVTVAIMHGLEIGLAPMQAIQKIAVINGRPSIWGDAIPALLWAKGFKLEEKELIRANTVGEVNGFECTVTRPDGTIIVRKFMEKDAKDAGLWGRNGPWKQYPKRMLQMRARGLAARDGAADVLLGMYLAEEAQDIPETISEPAIDITPDAETVAAIPDDLAELLSHECFAKRDGRPTAHSYKKDGGADVFLEINGQINEAETIAKLTQIPDLYCDEIAGMPVGWAKNIKEAICTKYEGLTQ